MLRTLWSVVRVGSRWLEESLERWSYALKRRGMRDKIHVCEEAGDNSGDTWSRGSDGRQKRSEVPI